MIRLPDAPHDVGLLVGVVQNEQDRNDVAVCIQLGRSRFVLPIEEVHVLVLGLGSAIAVAEQVRSGEMKLPDVLIDTDTATSDDIEQFLARSRRTH